MRKVMEPKAIKEESGEKESFAESGGCVRTRSSRVAKDRCKTPDSPEGARLVQAPSPTQSSPPSAHRPSSNGNSSPTDDSPTPPPLPQPNQQPLHQQQQLQQQQQVADVATPYVGLAPTIARPLLKVKKFLSTLVQFGGDIGQDVGERVKGLVLSLVSSNMSIEEFHHSLQDVTNFPLRPFVLPFLRTHLPLLQREVHALARGNKQSTLQYIRSHEHIILDPGYSTTEAADIFMPNDIPASKKRTLDNFYENGVNGQTHPDNPDYIPLKRPMVNNPNAFLLSHQNLFLPAMSANVSSSHFFDYTSHPHYANHHDASYSETASKCNRVDEEWRNIHVMLNCILSMVEKTKRALTILQQRSSQDVTNEWLRRQDVSGDLKKAANDIMIQAVRQTEERVSEVRRRAEDAVNDVKRQAVIELQKAVAAAETKANELVSAERAKMEKLLLDARKHQEEPLHPDVVAESSHSPTSQPVTSQQNSCWNCGRKAQETCSGCGVARYCGPFCQHRDWENHHQVCAKEKVRPTPGNANGVKHKK